MKKLIAIFSLTISCSVAGAAPQSYPCKIARYDGVELYGHCAKDKGITIFRSCAGFSCRVENNRDMLIPNKNTCSDSSNIIKEAKKEQKQDDLKLISPCRGTQKEL